MERGLIKVLIVDDCNVIRAQLTSIITSHFRDVDIYEADDGRSGYEMFVECKADLVITDLQMPNLNGEQMSSLIKSVSPTTPIVMFTSSPHSVTGQRYERVIDKDYVELKEWLREKYGRIKVRQNEGH